MSEKGSLELLIKLVDLLRDLENMESSIEFMSFEAQQILKEAVRQVTI